MTNKVKIFLVTFLFSFIFIPSSQAALLQIDSSGLLTGATGVIIDGESYDITFQDGSCIDLYSGCNESSDFTFTTRASATQAAQAIIDQVFIGIYDDDPNLTFGCSKQKNGFCLANVPYLAESPYIHVVSAWNRILGGSPDITHYRPMSPSDDVSRLNWNYVLFSPSSPATVPEGSPVILICIGLMTLFLNRRRISLVKPARGNGVKKWPSI